MNRNTLILGRTGCGKTHYLKEEATKKVKEGKNVLILDPYYEYNDVCKNIGGNLISFENASIYFNPFSIDYYELSPTKQVDFYFTLFRILINYEPKEIEIHMLKKGIYFVVSEYPFLSPLEKLDILENFLRENKDTCTNLSYHLFIFQSGIKKTLKEALFSFLKPGLTVIQRNLTSYFYLQLIDYAFEFFAKNNLETYILIDEFHRFYQDELVSLTNQFFSKIMTSSRKTNISLILCSQNVDFFHDRIDIQVWSSFQKFILFQNDYRNPFLNKLCNLSKEDLYHLSTKQDRLYVRLNRDGSILDKEYISK
jgi:Cdc6-like AAA superfamily ATPase